jgi:polyketide synthase PksR
MDGQARKKNDHLLQTVNVSIMMQQMMMADWDGTKDILIDRKELDANLSDNELFEQLLEKATQRGLKTAKDRQRRDIEKMVMIQEAYEANNYSILPLSDSRSVKCYYFRNKTRLFFGDLEHFFTFENDTSFENRDYWKDWMEQFPNFRIIDVDSSNHMVLLSEPKSSSVIIEFCKKLYKERP